MKKFGVVFGVAAIAAISGCRDPEFDGGEISSQNEVKAIGRAPAAATPAAATPVATTPVTVTPIAATPIAATPVTVKAVPASCTCPPGTVHETPCVCGAADCTCKVAPKAVATAAVVPETTVYIVQRGDTLSKISKRYNIKVDAIRTANGLKGDVIRIGQKLKLPGKVEVGEQKIPEGAFAKSAPKVYTPYAGETKDYVVKSGDTLGALAYGNGINVRQLKELNGLLGDQIRIGQKLKIPATKVTKPAVAANPAPVVASPAVNVPAPEAKPTAAPVEAASSVAEPVAPTVEPPAPVAEPTRTESVSAPVAGVGLTTTYVVQEGDDITSVSIAYGVSAAVIRELNNLEDGDQLKPGQVIKLPADQQ